MKTPKYMFQHGGVPKAIASRIAAGGAFLFLDYDGTLTRIVRDPDRAQISKTMIDALRRLSAEESASIAIISGRAIEDLKRFVPIPGLTLAGNHGMEIEAGGARFVHPAAEKAVPVLREAGRLLTRRLNKIPGAIVENKGYSLAVHYRKVSENRREEVEQTFMQTYNDLSGGNFLRVAEGKMVFELRPRTNWDKGKAVTFLMNRLPKKRAGKFPIYIGDDLTDEDAFKVVAEKGGAGVLVARLPFASNASYYLRGIREVRKFMLEILRAASRSK
ncbi:MAG: trehalose-phosphatase [bacterium]